MPTRSKAFRSSPAASTPAYDSEILRTTINGDFTTNTFAIGTAVSAGNTLGITVQHRVGASSVTDSQGNTYTVCATNCDGFNGGSVAVGYLTTGLSSSDTITITQPASGGFHERGITVHKITGAASAGQPDVATSATGFGTSPSAAASTTSANTVGIGLLVLGDTTTTYDGTWTEATKLTQSFNASVPIFTNFTSSGSKNPSGTMSASGGWFLVWAAIK